MPLILTQVMNKTLVMLHLAAHVPKPNAVTMATNPSPLKYDTVFQGEGMALEL